MPQNKVLPPEFYHSSDVESIAQKLLGKILVTHNHGITCRGMIVETEAYKAPEDKACHAFGNRLTQRTQTMFMTGGIAYVYTCYGIHPMFNVVTGPQGCAHAVLIRAVELLTECPQVLARRSMQSFSPMLANGPGKLTLAMGITVDMNGTSLFDPQSIITIEEAETTINDFDIVTTCRVGMSVHTGPCAYRPWRFYIKGNRWVSKPLFPDYSKLIQDKNYKY